MNTETALTVGQIADLAGVTIRTLHHYDKIGLIQPSHRTQSGYRMYDGAAINRLQEVMFFRELDFSLEDIRAILDQPTYERTDALHRQRDLLEAKAGLILNLIDAVERSIAAEQEGAPMTNEEKLEVFGDFDPSEHEAEVEQRWGATVEYAQSIKRTKDYGKADWEIINAENAEIYAQFVGLMPAGAKTPEARDVVERHRQHISRWYYDCSPQIHAGLGQMYIADERFTENIDKTAEGLAAFMAEAFAAAYA